MPLCIYTAADLDGLKILLDTARAMRDDDVASGIVHDEGTSILGAGITINYRGPRRRSSTRHIVVDAPFQGNVGSAKAPAMTTQEDHAMKITARSSCWTPWAAVLCAPCEHAYLTTAARLDGTAIYPKRLSTLSAITERAAEVEQPDDKLLARCTACQHPCWCQVDVALLQRVGFRLSDLDWEGPFGWSLQQTGGMCSALVITTANGHEIVVTAMDGLFIVGEYATSEWDPHLRLWDSKSFYQDNELVAPEQLVALVDECALTVLKFVHGKE